MLCDRRKNLRFFRAITFAAFQSASRRGNADGLNRTRSISAVGKHFLTTIAEREGNLWMKGRGTNKDCELVD